MMQYNAPIAIEIGILRNQLPTIDDATFHFTCFCFSAPPIPIKVAVTTCVVEVGAPIDVTTELINAAPI